MGFFGTAQAGKHPSSVSPVSKSFRLKYFSKNSIFWTISCGIYSIEPPWVFPQLYQPKPITINLLPFSTKLGRKIDADLSHLIPAIYCALTHWKILEWIHWWNTFVVVLSVALSITACATVIICSQIKSLDFLFPFWRQLMLGEGDHSTNQEVASLKTEPSPSRQSHGFLEGNGNNGNLKFIFR